MAQAVEHVLGKDEVTSSNLVNSSKGLHRKLWSPFAFAIPSGKMIKKCKKVLTNRVSHAII